MQGLLMTSVNPLATERKGRWHDGRLSLKPVKLATYSARHRRSPRVDVQSLKPAGVSQPGTVCTSSWICVDIAPVGNIVTRMDRNGDRLTLDYSTRAPGETECTPPLSIGTLGLGIGAMMPPYSCARTADPEDATHDYDC